MGERNITPSEVAIMSDPPAATLEWGGVIVEPENLTDSTELQVIAYPLQNNGRPDLDENPVGRFIAIAPGYLETAEYHRGRQITLSGQVIGIRQGSVGEADYLFPLIEPAEIQLWPLEGSRDGRTSIHFGIGTGFGTGGSHGSIGIGVGF